ncbi:MAG: DUF1460 domain-containing protein [Gemmatimonadetes bacterium]|nr:DUF1460 domain-containing protein [Gemmatimonadota bacterium]
MRARAVLALGAVVFAGLAAPGARAQERPAEGTARDWQIAHEQVAWAMTHRRAVGPGFGELLGAIGERLVGTRYEPHTLELAGPERLVVNLESLDCVTFVENVLVMARLAWTAEAALVEDPHRFEAAYRRELTAIRYRDGVLDGYPSRLHYFSEWIGNNEAKGLVDGISQALGGVVDESPLHFMSTHPDAYRHLADPGVLAAIAGTEAGLASVPRHYLPEDGIEDAARGIREGDIIAATSTVPGLDIAHTGIAVWRDGALRLMHAPLVGSHVQISDETLAERIGRIEGQDGIMVARPLPPR